MPATLNELITLADVSSRLNLSSALIALGVSFICAAIIYLVYRFFYRGTIYNENFNVLLVMVTMITCFIIMTVSSNLALSLGMVGALSIVRFRAAIKDPLDVGFVFWSVAAGLTAGAGLYLIALLGTIIIALIYLLMNWLKATKPHYLTIIKLQKSAETQVLAVLADFPHSLKNKTQVKNNTELIIETKGQPQFSELIQSIKGVDSLSTVEYNGDYLG